MQYSGKDLKQIKIQDLKTSFKVNFKILNLWFIPYFIRSNSGACSLFFVFLDLGRAGTNSQNLTIFS